MLFSAGEILAFEVEVAEGASVGSLFAFSDEGVFRFEVRAAVDFVEVFGILEILWRFGSEVLGLGELWCVTVFKSFEILFEFRFSFYFA